MREPAARPGDGQGVGTRRRRARIDRQRRRRAGRDRLQRERRARACRHAGHAQRNVPAEATGRRRRNGGRVGALLLNRQRRGRGGQREVR